MRLVMGVSSDGYLARSREDDMRWLGRTDKGLFRVLTGVGGVCGVGARSAECMPNVLAGRELKVITRSGLGMDLTAFGRLHPDGWLLGGPTLAMCALSNDLLDEVHMCRSDRYAFGPEGDTVGDGMRDCVTTFLENYNRPRSYQMHRRWELAMTTRVDEVTVETWRFHVT